MATLGVFVKEPIPGRVKTRLGKEIGEQLSAKLYNAFLHDFTDTVNSLEGIDSVFAYAPATSTAVQFFERLSKGRQTLWQQPETDLGSRMQSFFADHLTDGHPVVIVGSDSPTLPASLLQEAFLKLEETDAVLGPAVDGGYYLIGLRQLIPEMFADIQWSQENVLFETINRLQNRNHSFSLLTPWYDIDSLADLRFLRGHLAAMELAQADAASLTNTKRVMSEVLKLA